jgi:cell wall-associated NlpC family hydrolase
VCRTLETREDSRPGGWRHGGARGLLVLLMLGLSACSTAPPREAPPPPPAPPTHEDRVIDHVAHDVLFLAISMVGTPYRYGGNTPQGGFDCSGLIGYVFREAARLELPRTTRELHALPAVSVRRERLASGDLVFFGQRGRVDHAGIYVGEGRFVHAPSSGGTVRLDALDGPYWRDRFIAGRRVL